MLARLAVVPPVSSIELSLGSRIMLYQVIFLAWSGSCTAAPKVKLHTPMSRWRNFGHLMARLLDIVLLLALILRINEALFWV